jgi:negative regulator of flagellin synthesis FlgM
MGMTIDRIGPPDPIQPGKRPGRSESVKAGDKSDSISLSSEALEKSDLYQAIGLVASAPDVRAEKIAELKAKINDPAYINERIVDATAEKIMDAFGL